MVESYLYGLRNLGMKYNLDRMCDLMQALGNPQSQFPTIHVAGTNGKGSVCAMLESVYRAQGYKTGLHTSPHLIYLGERIRVNGRSLAYDKIVDYTNYLKSITEQIESLSGNDRPSFFELMVAMAFLNFAEEKVDIGIIETGLGGRLDATNIIQPKVCVITSIGKDHTDILGKDLATIAGEKAGIIKRNKPLVLGRVPQETEVVIRKVAEAKEAPVHSIKEIYGNSIENYPETNLIGDYQRYNAAMATEVIKLLADKGFPVAPSALNEGLCSVVWKARWECLRHSSGQNLILDAAHNEEAAKYLYQNLSEYTQKTQKKCSFIIGILGEERVQPILDSITPFAKEIIIVQPNQNRALPFDVIKQFVTKSFNGILRQASVQKLFPKPQTCSVGGLGETVVVTGSIYLIGEVMTQFQGLDEANILSLQDKL